MSKQEMSKQEVFNMCLNMYGQAVREYAKDMNTPYGMAAFNSMCAAQDELWSAAKDLAEAE